MKRPANQDTDRGHTIVTTNSSSPQSFEAPIVFEILRGRTDFPIRPLCHSEFLIGSGPDCDLRIGGSLPEFHSLIRWDGEELTIVAIAEPARMIVRGEVVERAVLAHGDCVCIGGVEFRVHLREAAAAGGPAPGALDDLSALSPAALVDLLEADLKQIGESEAEQRRARHWLEQQRREPTAGVPQAFLERLDRLVTLSAELDARERELAAREKECAEAARFLIQAQQALAAQLQQVQPAAGEPVTGSDLSAA